MLPTDEIMNVPVVGVVKGASTKAMVFPLASLNRPVPPVTVYRATAEFDPDGPRVTSSRNVPRTESFPLAPVSVNSPVATARVSLKNLMRVKAKS